MPVNWSHETDAMLLLAILRHHEMKIEYKKVADDLATSLNTDVKPKTIQNRIFRLKSGCAKTSTKNGDSPKKPSSQASTPRKRKKKDIVEEDEIEEDVHHQCEEQEEDLEDDFLVSESDDNDEETKKEEADSD